MIHDRMNEDGTPRRSNGMLMSVQNHRISIYCSRYNKQAPFTSCIAENSNNDNYYGGDDDDDDDVDNNDDNDGVVVVADHKYSYRDLEEKEQAERVSCKAFLYAVHTDFNVTPHAQYHSFFPIWIHFFPLLLERK